MTVLDASAVLAMLNNERGAGMVCDALAGAVMTTVNLAEVLGKVHDIGGDARRVLDALNSAGVRFETLSVWDAEVAAAFRGLIGRQSLSLGDRCCLAVAARSQPPEVLTANRLWADLDVPVSVTLIR